MVLEKIHLVVVGNVVQTAHLTSAQAVPADATFQLGVAFKDSDGSMYVTDGGTAYTFVEGLKVRDDGAVFVANATPAVSNEGIGQKGDGTLCAVASGTADTFNFGVPLVGGKVRVSTL